MKSESFLTLHRKQRNYHVSALDCNQKAFATIFWECASKNLTWSHLYECMVCAAPRRLLHTARAARRATTTSLHIVHIAACTHCIHCYTLLHVHIVHIAPATHCSRSQISLITWRDVLFVFIKKHNIRQFVIAAYCLLVVLLFN